ncbi:hypothetical protein FSST1_002629 [Fusarium sambucinum]
MRWMLFSGLYFRNRDLDRVRRTAKWIVAEAERRRIRRVVICGDLLISRTMQPTNILSAYYGFIRDLSDVVPHVNVLLGNHDLPHHHGYQTTALEALNIKRLAPHVSIHGDIDRQEWDGRQVLLLPLREDKSELTGSVAAIDPDEASKTVAFTVLAFNNAILQSCTPHTTNSITYRGLTCPTQLASLVRTFTGQFDYYRTITQNNIQSNGVDLRGSITYLGSPLQLSWRDLNDEQRGVVVFDPQTLRHELLINPHVVSYTLVAVDRVLNGQVYQDAIKDKHVMLLAKPAHINYVTARDSLFSLGARSIRDVTRMNTNQMRLKDLASTTPTSDIEVQYSEEPFQIENSLTEPSHIALKSNLSALPTIKALDIDAEAREYVESLDLDASLGSQRDDLVRAGQRIIQASRAITHQDDGLQVNYEDFLNDSYHTLGTRASNGLTVAKNNIFVAEPRTLTITNFLGVQHTITIHFRHDLPRGLTLLTGDSGYGKSTLGEAMVWCQFGRCIRNGLEADDVINDSIGMNCSVTLEFTNGYAITRYRRHQVQGNRVVITLNGERQPQVEHPDARTTQAAVNELLGLDYETYVRTVVLSRESTASFLNPTPIQRRDLIETSLGLPMLDEWGQMARLLLKNIDLKATAVRKSLGEVTRAINDNEQRLVELERQQERLANEESNAVASLESIRRQHKEKSDKIERRAHKANLTHASPDPRIKVFAFQKRIRIEQETLDQLWASYAELDRQRSVDTARWVADLYDRVRNKLKAIMRAPPRDRRRLFHSTYRIVLKFLLIAIRNCRFMFTSSESAHRQVIMDSLVREVDERKSRLKAVKREGNRAINNALTMSEKSLRLSRQAWTREVRQQTHRKRLQEQVTMKQSNVAVYRHLAEEERQSKRRLQSEHELLLNDLRAIARDHELFEFWASALSQRVNNPSSAASIKSKEKPTIGFRDHILLKAISELNVFLPKILTVMYGDAQHLNMATGMLYSIFCPDSGSEFAPSVLNSKLPLNTSLSYGKRSACERKRVDLALFFALLHLGRAKSAHHAHYVLLDEVFDNLDNADQAAAIRWLSVMPETVMGWVVVITHSQVLIERDLGHDSGKGLVVRANMGQDGTEFSVNGCIIGRD